MSLGHPEFVTFLAIFQTKTFQILQVPLHLLNHHVKPKPLRSKTCLNVSLPYILVEKTRMAAMAFQTCRVHHEEAKCDAAPVTSITGA